MNDQRLDKAGSAREGASGLRPARFTVSLAAAVEGGAEGVGEMFDRLYDALDAVPGVFSGDGACEFMEPGDLIADSPLDRYLRAAGGASDGD